MTPESEPTESGGKKGDETVTDPSKSEGDSTESSNHDDSGPDTGKTPKAGE